MLLQARLVPYVMCESGSGKHPPRLGDRFALAAFRATPLHVLESSSLPLQPSQPRATITRVSRSIPEQHYTNFSEYRISDRKHADKVRRQPRTLEATRLPGNETHTDMTLLLPGSARSRARRSNSTSSLTTRYILPASRSSSDGAELSEANANEWSATDLEDKRARGGEGGHPAGAAEVDLRREADVRIILIYRRWHSKEVVGRQRL